MNPATKPATTGLSEAFGLVAPLRTVWAWPPDRHLLAALMAALPVWLALAAFGGGQLRAPAGAYAWLSLVLVQPLLEEAVFRGLLQGQALRLTAARRLGPLSWANLGCSVAFAALHLPTQAWPWALAVLPPSLVFGHLRERFGSVWPAVALHVVYNAGFGVAAAFARS